MSMTVEEKDAENIWDNIDDFIRVLEKARSREWRWIGNPDCKYVELRVDMRNGGCIIYNRHGKRINPDDLAYQQKFDKEKL